MEPSKVNEQILKALFKKFIHASNKAMSMKQIRVGFEHIDADTFFDTVAELISEGQLQDQGQGFITLSPEGWKKAQSMAAPPARAKAPAPGKAAHSKINHSARQKPSAESPPNPLIENMVWLIDLMTPNLPALKLAPEEHQKALEHLANLKRLMVGTPNPALVKAVCSSLKKTTEGAINNLLAAGVQPAVWGAVLALFGQL